MNLETKIEQKKEVGQRMSCWSIGIFSGPALSDLSPSPRARNPVLSEGDVTDVHAQFVADPFMIKAQDAWHMFFEVMNAQTGKGDIGLAASKDGLHWEYQQIVLSEPFHLSYPHVFCAGGEY